MIAASNVFETYSYPGKFTNEVSGYPAVATIIDLNAYKAALSVKHKAEVERLVTNATNNTYNEESDYDQIIQLGGDLWQANPGSVEPVAAGETDPAEFVLIYKGEVQKLAYAEMDSLQREAERDLKSHQLAIATLIENIGSGL